MSGTTLIATRVDDKTLRNILGITEENLMCHSLVDLKHVSMLNRLRYSFPYLAMNEKEKATGNAFHIITRMANGGNFYNGHFLKAMASRLFQIYSDWKIRNLLELQLTVDIHYHTSGGGGEMFYYHYDTTVTDSSGAIVLTSYSKS